MSALPVTTALALLLAVTMSASQAAEPFTLTVRERGEQTSSTRPVEWDPSKTAIIVCDMWDSHHSVTAVRRANEFAPRLNAVLKHARKQGAIIIHSPSDCMPAYEGHAARVRALEVPAAKNPPADIGAWCHRIPAEEKAVYPIDQSDGGEDESKWENDEWARALEAEGRKPGTPWLRQNPVLEINEASDFIASEGEVVWNILKARGIEHVILSGVHTNMCVLGRPFGLRNLVRNKVDTVLMRDCTDVMYNPARWPYVSHFTGLDLIIEHIERHVCPTVTSDQFVGGRAFRFEHDDRPHLLVVVDPDNADGVRSYSRRFLDPSFKVSFAVVGEGASKFDSLDAMVITTDKFGVDISPTNSRPQVLVNSGAANGKSIRPSGGRVFGVNGKGEEFERLLFEGIHWAVGRPVPDAVPEDPDLRRKREGWRAVGDKQAAGSKARDLRTLLRAPTGLEERERVLVARAKEVHLNGVALAASGNGKWLIPADGLAAGDLNLIVLRLNEDPGPPKVSILDGDKLHHLDSEHWQERIDEGAGPDVTFPIPPQFGAPADLIQNW